MRIAQGGIRGRTTSSSSAMSYRGTIGSTGRRKAPLSSSKSTLSTGKIKGRRNSSSGDSSNQHVGDNFFPSSYYIGTAYANEHQEDPLAFSSLIEGDSVLRQEGALDERDGAFAWEVADWPDFSSTEHGAPPSIPNYLSSYVDAAAAAATTEGAEGRDDSVGSSWEQQINTFSSSASGDNHEYHHNDAATVMSVESSLSRSSSVNSILSLKNKWVSKVAGFKKQQQQQQHSSTTATTTTATSAVSYHSEVRSDVETSQRALDFERVVDGEEETREETTTDDNMHYVSDEEDDELFSALLDEDLALIMEGTSHDNDEAEAAPISDDNNKTAVSTRSAPTIESDRSATTTPAESMAPSAERSTGAPADNSSAESTSTNRDGGSSAVAFAPTPSSAGRSRRADSISTRFHWKGSKPSSNLSDDDAGREIAEIAYVLRASLTLQTLVSSGAKDAQRSLQDQVLQGVLSSELAETAGQVDQELIKKQKYLQGLHEFRGNEAKEALMTLNVDSTAQEAEAQLGLLLYGGYIISSTPLGRRSFDDGASYRFASREELEATYTLLQREDASSIVGCKEKILCSAIETTLALPEAAVGSLSDSIVYTAMVTSHQRGSKGKRNIIRRVRHILTYIVGTDQLTVRDILRLMAWCRDYRSEDHTYQNQRDLMREESDREQEDRLNAMLFDEYRKRIRLQVRKWLDKSSWQRDDIVLSTNPVGRIVSHHPEDILFMVQVEMNIVRETLPNSNAMEIMVDLLEEFKLSQIGMKLTLKSDWENMDIEWLCAVVNDSSTLMEYVENFSIFGHTNARPVQPTTELQKARDEVIAGYQVLSSEACDHLASSIIRDLQGPVLDLIFTDQWEQEGQTMKCVEATLKDYFEDLSVSGWIPQHEFCRVAKQCISTFTEQYVTAVFSEKHQGRPFSDAKAVPARLVQDRLILMQFFSHVELEMNCRGAKSHAEDCLKVLLLMSAILKADEPDEIEEEINSFYSHVGIKYGHAAIMHLVGRKAGRYSQRNHDKWDAGLTLIADEDEIEGSRLENLDLDHLLEAQRVNAFNFPKSTKNPDASPSVSYDAEGEDDTTSYTRTIGSCESEATMLTNPKGCFASPRGRHGKSNDERRGSDGKDHEDDNNNVLDMERLKEISDRVITRSSETFCWVLDSALDIGDVLREMATKAEKKGCQSCATEVAEDILNLESVSDLEDENPSKTIPQEEPKKKRGLRKIWKRKKVSA